MLDFSKGFKKEVGSDTYKVLRRGHVKILQRHSHSAGLVDFYITLLDIDYRGK